MALSAEAFQQFVGANLDAAFLIGEALGGGFSNVAFVNALRRRYPELSIQQVGAFATFTIAAGRAANQAELLPPGTEFNPGPVPFIPSYFVDQPASVVYRVRVTVFIRDPVTGLSTARVVVVTLSSPADFTTISEIAQNLARDVLQNSPDIAALVSSQAEFLVDLNLLVQR